MYAIVEIAGQQFKVERGQRVYVHRLEANEGANVEFDKVYLTDNAGKISVGNPVIDGAKVAATVISHVKGDKVAVFKKKRRKTYQKWNNHRQQYTEILIQGVLAKGESLKDSLTAVARPVKTHRKFDINAKTDETVLVEETAAPAKKAAPKKAAAKKVTKKKE
jgi:large subunit ribosomal protein L21